jgi:hypothetical protein
MPLKAMMGRQVNFYLSESDQRNILLDLKKKMDVSAILPPVKSTKLSPMDPLLLVKGKSIEDDPVLFLSKDLQSLTCRLHGSGAGYMIDPGENPVIQFWRSITKDNTIERGRFFYVPVVFGPDGSKQEKSADFLAFAKHLFYIVKKQCKLRGNGFYVGNEAAEMEREGFKLVE